MAIIDYKQKIKDYMNSSEVDTLYKSMLNNLFPELKESREDERIRKAAIAFVKASDHFGYHLGISKEKVIAWLEKQGISELSEDLGEYLYELSKQFPEVSFAKLSRIGVRVAKWQKEQLRTVGDRTMSKAEIFISEHTRNCSNVFVNPQLGGTEENHPWLTPDQARRVAEIAREETIKEVCELLKNNIAEYVLPNKGLDIDWFIEDLKKNLEDKV